MKTHCKLAVEESIYKYRMVRLLGRGNFGEVWLAHDTTLAKDVAVKILYEKDQLNQCLNEARIGNFLSHDNLVKILYADIIKRGNEEFVFIAMDFHSKGAITRYLNSHNFLPITEALAVLQDVLRGLEYLHEKNFFHNDIKPQNILLGEVGQGILTDYGITSFSPQKEAIEPTDAYISHIAPEVILQNKISVQTDIYQFGLTAFRLINGIGVIHDQQSKCGEGEFYDIVLRGKVIENKDYLPFVPTNLRRIINKAISVNPKDRYQSATEMRRALEKINYSGYWTTTKNGDFFGSSGNYEYRFTENCLGRKNFTFEAFKKNKTSLREVKISAFSAKNLSMSEVERVRQKFMAHVVTG